jgi:hypothetical protein
MRGQYGSIHSLIDQGDCGIAGKPGALVVPAGADMVAAPPVRPVFGAAGPVRLGGDQARDLWDGQRRSSPGRRGAVHRA